ncbi:MAG: hypothetical protein Q9187_009620, partial [Circinaria calcarea]
MAFNAGEIRKSERAGLSGEHKGELLEHTIKDCCGGVTTINSRRSENKDEPTGLIDDHSEACDAEPAEREAGGGGYTSDDSNADGQGGDLDSPNTQPTSAAGSETG